MQIGTLTGPTEFPEYKRDSGFYRELCDEVGNYFTKNNIDSKSLWPGAWRMALVFGVAAVSYFAMHGVIGELPLWGKLLFAAVYGVCQALPLVRVNLITSSP